MEKDRQEHAAEGGGHNGKYQVRLLRTICNDY